MFRAGVGLVDPHRSVFRHFACDARQEEQLTSESESPYRGRNRAADG